MKSNIRLKIPYSGTAAEATGVMLSITDDHRSEHTHEFTLDLTEAYELFRQLTECVRDFRAAQREKVDQTLAAALKEVEEVLDN